MYARAMKRKDSAVAAILAAIALGSSLILVSGCATDGASDSDKKGSGVRSLKSDEEYGDPAYKRTNRRGSQTHPPPF